MNRAIFLDRDGTLIRAYDGRPANTADEVELLPGVADGLSSLKKQGFLLVVCTNQGGVSLGYMTLDTLKAQHERLDDLLLLAGAPRLDAFYWCAHGLNDGCDCRKPNPGMILDAAEDLDVDLSRSYMVGDDHRDVAAGKAAGVRKTIQVASDRYDGKSAADVLLHSFSLVPETVLSMED